MEMALPGGCFSGYFQAKLPVGNARAGCCHFRRNNATSGI
jgi:hypothetical protein